ncbi:MAG: hypothetical protein ACYCYO_22180 [Bacilli bacterium]
MTNKAKILSTLSSAELCDDCLSVASGVHPRQTINELCRELSIAGVITRIQGNCGKCLKVKLVNRLPDGLRAQPETKPPSPTSAEVPATAKWYWEGNVQARVVSYLASNGHMIRSVADTASREAGKDIVAIAPDGNELWVSVKGYPEKSANVQARHWFSGAVFDLALYHGQAPNVKLALGLPDGFATYTNLLPRIEWLKQTMQFSVFWVGEDGSVRVE